MNYLPLCQYKQVLRIILLKIPPNRKVAVRQVADTPLKYL